ncbi:transglycosylase family protein [Nesterenkonia sp.]|uniref:LysM peptidoglycan-binding domain-containing protein n=1 Tax=Nesterenkonia sp. TaxID=704201 RepID=UPI002617F229|nr:transglycosylase family protein [Nesterenkonia sp.]
MKTPKTIKKVVGGSMAAATLAGGAMLAQAPAASATGVWDRLAECESGGNWSINTGNGFYGGLQFTPQSWQAVGGSGLPHEASREEQINRAQKLQAIQGWGAWPACSAKLGLYGEDPGTSSPEPVQQQEQAEPAPQPQQQEQAEPAPQPQQQTQPAPQAQPEVQEAPQQSYSAAGEFTAEPNADVEVGEETYTVAAGDSLSSIAAELDIDWKDLWGANMDLIEDPNLIYVGDELKLPVTN